MFDTSSEIISLKQNALDRAEGRIGSLTTATEYFPTFEVIFFTIALNNIYTGKPK